MNTLKDVSQIHWRTYANDHQKRKYAVVYHSKDALSAIKANTAVEVARAILQVTTEQGLIVYVGPFQEYARRNDL